MEPRQPRAKRVVSLPLKEEPNYVGRVDGDLLGSRIGLIQKLHDKISHGCQDGSIVAPYGQHRAESLAMSLS